jgi:hypothetical protein
VKSDFFIEIPENWCFYEKSAEDGCKNPNLFLVGFVAKAAIKRHWWMKYNAKTLYFSDKQSIESALPTPIAIPRCTQKMKRGTVAELRACGVQDQRFRDVL